MLTNLAFLIFRVTIRMYEWQLIWTSGLLIAFVEKTWKLNGQQCRMNGNNHRECVNALPNYDYSRLKIIK